MGKYMRRAKTSGDFALMDVSPKSSFGVRTRAKTLALRRLQNPSSSPEDSFSFLQLRSRRLEKFLPPEIKPEMQCKASLRSNPSLNLSVDYGSVPLSRTVELVLCSGDLVNGSASPQPPLINDSDFEAFYGENILEAEVDRRGRETTPSSQIRNADDLGTPCSSNRSSAATTNRSRATVHSSFPNTREMEEFFSGAEQMQLKSFTDKYNYDPVNDCPLPGRYDWIKQ